MKCSSNSNSNNKHKNDDTNSHPCFINGSNFFSTASKCCRAFPTKRPMAPTVPIRRDTCIAVFAQKFIYNMCMCVCGEGSKFSVRIPNDDTQLPSAFYD